MATPNPPATLDTPIAVKILFKGHVKKFKIPLRDLGANVLPQKLRTLLQLQPSDKVVFERYSDSAASYVTLDPENHHVYKTLFRAAKAKLKLRLRATLPEEERGSAVRVATHAFSSASSYVPPTDLYAPPLYGNMPPSFAYNSYVPFSHQLAVPQSTVQPDKSGPVLPPVPETSQPKKVDSKAEAPVSPPSNTSQNSAPNTVDNFAGLAFRPKEVVQGPWVVYCNNCDVAMENEHFHCSICENGDYDLCLNCVGDGVHCPGSNHWLLKRFVKDGQVENSSTERIAPKADSKPKAKSVADQGMPGAFMEEKQPVVIDLTAEEPDRTCNCCVKVLPEKEFVTCTACDDYDLCKECHIRNKHGHHPGHAFKAATKETILPPIADFLCNAGRNVRHSAVCDGCEKYIYGVRHKCLNCPDFDFCGGCIKSAKSTHPRHRFVPIYEPLAEPYTTGRRHYGIYCDGPLCKDREVLSYIEGVRYKCAVCHDTDFCANCEALPTNKHNHTHPLIKFKTPVHNVSITTINEGKNGQTLARLGDQHSKQHPPKIDADEAAFANAVTQVQAYLDMKPTEEKQAKTPKEKIQIRDLLAEPVQEKITLNNRDSVAATAPAPVEAPKKVAVPVTETPKKDTNELDAHFIRDTIKDGSHIAAGMTFVQVWTLRNPGPNAWPAGCSVRHVGGDNMLNLDNTRPLSQSELAEASESNVVGRPVEAGEEISFRVLMKAPSREGTAISYWRLKTADGMGFGHRLWCDIQVVAPPSPSVLPSAHPVLTENGAPTYPGIDRNVMGGNQRMEQGPPKMLKERELEHMLHVQQVRRAAVMRILDARHKAQELALQHAEASASAEGAKRDAKQDSAELPVEEKAVEAQTEAESSGMIFPQLEKESPESSTHEALSDKSESGEDKPGSTTVVASEQSDEEFFEDAESVDIRSFSGDDDEAFMTDEEYDILNASDEEAT